MCRVGDHGILFLLHFFICFLVLCGGADAILPMFKTEANFYLDPGNGKYFDKK